MCEKPYGCQHEEWVYVISPNRKAPDIFRNMVREHAYQPFEIHTIHTDAGFVNFLWTKVKTAIERGHLANVGGRASTNQGYSRFGFGLHKIELYNSMALESVGDLETDLWNFLGIRKKIHYE